MRIVCWIIPATRSRSGREGGGAYFGSRGSGLGFLQATTPTRQPQKKLTNALSTRSSGEYV